MPHFVYEEKIARYLLKEKYYNSCTYAEIIKDCFTIYAITTDLNLRLKVMSVTPGKFDGTSFLFQIFIQDLNLGGKEETGLMLNLATIFSDVKVFK